jgi:hypothetical protein
MNLIAILQLVVKLALLLLLGILPLHSLLAQEAGKQEHKMHIKMIRTADGKTVVIDTTLTSATHEDLVKALQAAKLDTASLRLLHGKARAYTLGAGGKDGLRVRVNELKGDTIRLRQPVDVRLRALEGDSLKGDVVRYVDIIRVDGKATTLKGNPQVYIRTEKDSSRVFELKGAQALHPMRSAEFERIIVETLPGLKRDSLMLKEDASYIKITPDEKTGQPKIYRIQPDGSEVEVKGEEIRLGIAGPARAFFFVQAKVEDITPEEKQQLKETGAPVEMKSKEELKVEEINYYPNPNNGRFNINFKLKNKGTTVVRIMDSKGDEVFVDTVEKLSGEYSRQVDISPFGPGLYYLQVAQNGRYHTKKLLVQ